MKKKYSRETGLLFKQRGRTLQYCSTTRAYTPQSAECCSFPKLSKRDCGEWQRMKFDSWWGARDCREKIYIELETTRPDRMCRLIVDRIVKTLKLLVYVIDGGNVKNEFAVSFGCGAWGRCVLRFELKKKSTVRWVGNQSTMISTWTLMLALYRIFLSMIGMRSVRSPTFHNIYLFLGADFFVV